jgi:hypothetical protein
MHFLFCLFTQAECILSYCVHSFWFLCHLATLYQLWNEIGNEDDSLLGESAM